LIITRTPLRISLGGGGTDLPAYYRSCQGGFLIAAAIDRHVYIALNRNFDGDLLLKYSATERAASPAGVSHPLLREALLTAGTHDGVEISSMADVPAGTGLGSSGSFTVGLLRALMTYKRQPASPRELAELACTIEIERLGAPVGKQDPYIAAVGGITAFTFNPDDTVGIAPVALDEETRHHLEENLLLFFTGVRRSAGDELTTQGAGITLDDSTRVNLDAVRALGEQSRSALETGDLAAFAGLMNEQWQQKYARARSEVHDTVDGWLRDGLAAGAMGGKLVGAGGGGFLLFYAEAKDDLRRAMRVHGLEELRFGFDDEGTTTLVR
jgi:D-glycero-alpha-D-manno-heptose-7-phosphate kinase